MKIKETYSVTIDPNIVERAKRLYISDGGKLSPLMEQLLKEWCDKKEGKK